MKLSTPMLGVKNYVPAAGFPLEAFDDRMAFKVPVFHQIQDSSALRGVVSRIYPVYAYTYRSQQNDRFMTAVVGPILAFRTCESPFRSEASLLQQPGGYPEFCLLD